MAGRVFKGRRRSEQDVQHAQLEAPSRKGIVVPVQPVRLYLRALVASASGCWPETVAAAYMTHLQRVTSFRAGRCEQRVVVSPRPKLAAGCLLLPFEGIQCRRADQLPRLPYYYMRKV